MSSRFQGKQVFLTGADGFIGSHLAEKLVSEGANLKALVYYNSFNSWGWLDYIDPKIKNQIEVVMGDIRDPNQMKTLSKNTDYIFHLASLIGIPFSYVAPDLYVDTNIKGTLNLLQAARDNNVSRILITSTSEVYGTARTVPISETHPLQGQSPYSASKIGADKIAESFYLSFKLPVVTVRPFNTYGPRQSTRAVIPTIITQILNNEKRIKLGSITPTRDLVYVLETVEGFIQLATSSKTIGETINISTGREISVENLVKTIAKILDREIEIESEEIRLRPKDSEVERLLGDNRKLESLTGWKPSIEIEEGLRKTIDWFSNKENLNLYKSGTYTV